VNDPSDSCLFDLPSLGFSSDFERAFAPHTIHGRSPGRVAAEHRDGYVLLTAFGEVHAELAGRLRHAAGSRADLPAVGDWVAFRREPRNEGAAVIDAVLPRKTAFVRAVAGGLTEPQVVAANVDVIVIVCALGQDSNPRRIERYLSVARSSGAEVVVALTKADLHDAEADPIRAVTGDAVLIVTSSVSGLGIDALGALLGGARTMALVGSSGVGKSTLLNRLAGRSNADPVQATAALGVDGRGRHTTTHRELFVLPRGGLVLDTPGMRELRLWDADEGLDETFSDINELASRCRFGDCAHDTEPGCAVRAALDTGVLSSSRHASYQKLQREMHVLERRRDARLAAEDKRKIKVFSRAARVRDRFTR